MEPQDRTDESFESATDGDGCASSLVEVNSKCYQDDCVTHYMSSKRKWQPPWVKQFPLKKGHWAK